MTSAARLTDPAALPAQHRRDPLSGTTPAGSLAATGTQVQAVLDWSSPDLGFSRTRDRLFASAVYTRPGAEPLTVEIMATYLNDMWGGAEGTTSSRNFDRPDRTAPGSTAGLFLHQTRTRRSPRGELGQRRMDRGNYTFSFSRPVTDLTFSLTFLDALAGMPRDAVELTAGFRVTDRASRTTGTGAARDPFRIRAGRSADDGIRSGSGDVQVTYPGELSRFSVDYWNIQEHATVLAEQTTCLSDLSFAFSPMHPVAGVGGAE